MVPNDSLLNSVGLLLLAAVVTFLTTAYWFRRNASIKEADRLAVEHQKVLDRLSEMEVKFATVNQAIIPISTAFQAILIKELTHYHTPEMDELMRKIGPPNTLTENEEIRLSVLLRERTLDMGPLISDSERDAALILPAIMKRARIEADKLKGAEELKLRLVTIAAVVGLPVVMTEPGSPPLVLGGGQTSDDPKS
jgi:hypothetical protein